MHEGKSYQDDNTIDTITQALELTLSKLQDFESGHSNDKAMKKTKRPRPDSEKEKSPGTASPPTKEGRTARSMRLRSRAKKLTKTKEGKSKKDPTPTTEPVPGPSEATILEPDYAMISGESMSSAIESEDSDHVESDAPTEENITVIETPITNPYSPPKEAPLLSGPNKYTIDIGLLDYVLGASPIRPRDFPQTMRLWYSDQWENLEVPPDKLTSTVYLMCIPSEVPNSEKIRLMNIATRNLEMARLHKRYLLKDSELFTKDFNEWIPTVSTQAPIKTEIDPSPQSLLTDQFLQVTKELLDTVRVVQKDIDRNAFLFRSVCVDTSQGLREGGERMVREIKGITGLVATATTPIAKPSTDKSTTMPPPAPPARPTTRRTTRPPGPLSMTVKPKK